MKGFCVWFSGIPSAGKSTLANSLKKRLEKDFGLPSTILDGDEIRENITKGLGFSDKDRFENVTRVGWMAARIVEAGGIAIVAMVSPAADARQAARNLIGDDNVYQVFVNCSLKGAIERDVKGLYAKAQRGEIKGLTGYDAEYQEPETGIDITTEHCTVEAATDYLIQQLQVENFLSEGKTALFIGRWSPFHNGHKYIIEQAIKDGKRVAIGVRRSEDQWSVGDRIKMIQAVYPDAIVFPMVDIESVNIGRLVGYDVNRYDVPADIHGISATEIRRLMAEGNDEWKKRVPPEVAKLLS